MGLHDTLKGGHCHLAFGGKLSLFPPFLLLMGISVFEAHAVGIRVHRPRYRIAGSKAANVKGRVAPRQSLPLTEPPLSAHLRV